MIVDPIYIQLGALSVAIILGSAASHKLRANYWFTKQLADYALLPNALLKPTARIIPLVEIGLALGLLVPTVRFWAACGAALLFAIYALAMGINLWRGRRDLDCGCAGPEHSQPVHPFLLLRNTFLVLLAVLAAQTPMLRETGIFDWIIIFFASTTLVLLYTASDNLLATAPRLRTLIGK